MTGSEGQTLSDGRYRLLSPLGRGGMGEVWRAWDERLALPRAIKLLNTGTTDPERARLRFEREARILARLRHPNIVAVTDLGFEGDQPYLVMELVEGGDLAGRLQRGPMPADEAVEILLGVLDALSYAHERGIIHRDVKPRNVLLDGEGRPRLADFGVARMLLVEGDPITATGAQVGTPGFMAPEQILGDVPLDARVDVYAAGATLNALVTGGRSASATWGAGSTQPQVAPPDWLAPIITRATQPDPAKRFPSAAEMAGALCAAQAAHQSPGLPARRAGLSLLGGVVLLGICTLIAVLSLLLPSAAPPPAPEPAPAASPAADPEARATRPPTSERPTGTLELRTLGEASVFVDGKLVGESPQTLTLTEGNHKLRLQQGTVRISSILIKMKAGDTQRICWDVAHRRPCPAEDAL